MRSGPRRHLAKLGLVGALVTGLAGVGGMWTTAPAGAATSGAPIKIALITSETGFAASEFLGAADAFNARIALQNSIGGVNGHKLVGIVFDDATSPTQVVTAVQDALSKGAIGIVSDSALFFLAAKYPQEAGVPVTGTDLDGPEWGEQPYTNMFAADSGSDDPAFPINTMVASFVKAHGGTVLGSYGLSISPSSTREATAVADAFQREGGHVGVLDTTVPFGSVNFTTAALAAKQKGVNALAPVMTDSSEFAIATAYKQEGIKPKVVVLSTGYEQSAIHSAAWQALQGAYFTSYFRPFSLPNAGTTHMQAALEKYAHFTATDFPNDAQYRSWVSADLMIKGLQQAGKNPTSAEVIKALRSIKAYNANGLLPYTLNFSTAFGHDPAQGQCAWFMVAKKNGFVPSSSHAWCGKNIPGTSVAAS
jgi:branched-chain amino acid transport system substrate-binding protein